MTHRRAGAVLACALAAAALAAVEDRRSGPGAESPEATDHALASPPRREVAAPPGPRPPAAPEPPAPLARREAEAPVTFEAPPPRLERGPAVRLRRGDVLAAVNGTPVTAADLVSFGGGRPEDERGMTPEMFRFLRDRAIERELVLQVARAKGIELSGAQGRRVEEIRAGLLHSDPDVIAPATVDPDAVALEVRDATALLLRSSLADGAGVRSPFVTKADVEDRRAAGSSETEARIRADLAAEILASHRVELRRFVGALRAEAEILVYVAVPDDSSGQSSK